MRYWFLYIALWLLTPTMACSQEKKQSVTPASQAMPAHDELLHRALIDSATTYNWSALPLSKIELKVASAFLGTPYVAATLEADGEEQLVVNLREMDCTTFVENVLALSRCIKNQQYSFCQFRQELTRIRYRNGIIDRYPSRLHYFTDWMLDNQQKGIVSIVTEKMGTANFDASVGFMSANPDKYKALREHPEFVPIIAEQEARINQTQLKYIPKQDVPALENQINDGDIIAIATIIDGLDIAHVGIAVHTNGRLHMLHASTTEKKVVMTPGPLADYLAGIKRHSGILVARPIAP